MGLEGHALLQHPRGQVSLGESKKLLIILPLSKLLSVQFTVQKGFFSIIDHLSCLVAKAGNYFSVLVPGTEKMNRHLLFPAIFPNL